MIKFGELGAISGGSLACVARSLVKYVTPRSVASFISNDGMELHCPLGTYYAINELTSFFSFASKQFQNSFVYKICE